MLRESHRPGIEPATCKSQVQRPTTEPPRNTFESNISDFFYSYLNICRRCKIVNWWNVSISADILSLPNYVVLSDTVNMFKSRLDKFLQHQDVIYDFKAEIRGTGSRSCY